MLTTLVLRWRMRGREQRGEDEGPSRPLASRLLGTWRRLLLLPSEGRWLPP